MDKEGTSGKPRDMGKGLKGRIVEFGYKDLGLRICDFKCRVLGFRV